MVVFLVPAWASSAESSRGRFPIYPRPPSRIILNDGCGELIEGQAVRVPRVQYKIGRLMVVVAVAALVLTPFAWSPPESRGLLLVAVLTFVTMLLILSGPFLIDRFEGGQTPLRPRTKQTKPLPRLLRPFFWAGPPHKREKYLARRKTARTLPPSFPGKDRHGPGSTARRVESGPDREGG